MHLLETDHFAFETHAEEIGQLILQFLDRGRTPHAAAR